MKRLFILIVFCITSNVFSSAALTIVEVSRTLLSPPCHWRVHLRISSNVVGLGTFAITVPAGVVFDSNPAQNTALGTGTPPQQNPGFYILTGDLVLGVFTVAPWDFYIEVVGAGSFSITATDDNFPATTATTTVTIACPTITVISGGLSGGPQNVAFSNTENSGFELKDKYFEFTNLTGQPICDLLLSTKSSPGNNPDFEGMAHVYRKNFLPPPNNNIPTGMGTNLDWIIFPGTPFPADGVEVLKINGSVCIQPGEVVMLQIAMDDFESNDTLTITPTDSNFKIILPGTPQTITKPVSFYQGYEGLPGSLAATYVGTNGTGSYITALTFNSLSSGISVIQVTSSIGSNYNPTTHILSFNTPIPNCGALDYSFELSGLPPFDENDPNPYTTVSIVANAIIPTLTQWA